MNILDYKLYFYDQLEGLYPENEVRSMLHYIYKSKFKLHPAVIAMEKSRTFNEIEVQDLKGIVERLKKYEPLQYIFGKSYFLDYEFVVSPDVLIPRPETEELVLHAIDYLKPKDKAKVVDIGTGSGCIAISLKKKYTELQVLGIDISEKALEVAEENAIIHKADIRFFRADMISGPFEYLVPPFDLVIGNPPYVALEEKHLMTENTKYEPSAALFVKGNDIPAFYKKIVDAWYPYLKRDGRIMLEINENFGTTLLNGLNSIGAIIELYKDINNKSRILIVEKKG